MIPVRAAHFGIFWEGAVKSIKLSKQMPSYIEIKFNQQFVKYRVFLTKGQLILFQIILKTSNSSHLQCLSKVSIHINCLSSVIEARTTWNLMKTDL